MKRKILIGLVAAMFLAASTATAEPAGKGLFDFLYGSASGEWEDSSGCPPGGCPGEPVQWELQGTREQAATPPTSVVHVNGSSGVIVAMGGRDVAILTAYHMVEGTSGTNVSIRLANGKACKGEVCRKTDGSFAVNKAADIALVGIKSKTDLEPFCPLAEEQPRLGDPVWICGFGPNDVYRRIPGKVVGFSDESYGKRPCGPDDIMVMSGEAQMGDSGGPIFDAAGKVCGIVSRSTHDEPMASDRTWSTSLNQIAALCADTIFPFPWRKQVERELEEAKQLPVPYPPSPQVQPQASFVSTKVEAKLTELEGRVAAIESLKPDFERVQKIAEAAVAASESASTDMGKQFAAEVAGIKAKTEAAEKAATAATTKAVEVAKEAEEKRGILGKTVDALTSAVNAPKRLIQWTLGNTVNAAGMGILSFILLMLWKKVLKPDIKAYQQYGDPLLIQPTVDYLKRMIPGKIDDWALDFAVRTAFGQPGTAPPPGAPAPPAAPPAGGPGQ